jgi:hypothetical protein
MEKCAFNVNSDGISCYSLESLQKIANAYNKKYNDNINISNDKNELKRILKNKLKSICNDEKCWKDLDFIKNLNDENINKYTFKPDAPQGKYAWLSTIDIDDVMNQISKAHPKFKFLGAVPMDFDSIPFLGIRDLDFETLHHQEKKSKLGIVFNTDPSYKSGEHWISSYMDLDKKQIYFFDSVGTKPNKEVRNFLARGAKYMMKYHNCPLSDIDVMYNYLQHQKGNSECGVYSINFLKRMVNGESFNDIINNQLSDDKVNKCREVYFSG